VISYAVYLVFVVLVDLFARPGIPSALIRGPELVAQVVFTPLLAGMSIWIGIGVSARTNDVRTAQQVATLASLPAIAVTSLVAYKVIPASTGLAVALGAALLAVDRIGWRVTSAAFDRERLITSTK
jgi:ABC-2 type transport system permease protein